ncbi:MAG: hypothetical protein MUP21_08905 [Dehalococcoidia bacterium]|nr:hypothetical protein [Dehalococcoidia bacterium]
MLEQFRDIMIIISAFLVIGAALTFIILTIVTFRKITPTLDAAHDFFTDLKSVSSFVSGKMLKPVTRGAIFAAGVRKAISTISERSHRKERKDGK